MTKVLIIVNPSAGDEKSLEVASQLQSIYSEKEIETITYETTGEDDFKEVIQHAMNKGYMTLALLGGDGTISEIVNSIAELDRRPKIILLPSGTTNNFARTITENQTRAEILEAIENDQLKEIEVDIGRMNDQYFISSIAVGVLPAVGWEADEDLKAKLGSFAYFLEGLKFIQEDEQESFNLKIKSNQIDQIEEEVFLFIVGLSNSIFGIQSFFENASVDDGELHYFALKKAGILPEISSMIKYISKNAENDELVFTGSFREALIDSESQLNFLIDGEKGPKFPVELGILPKHLTFIVPENS